MQVDYSLLNRQAEDELLPYCEREGIAVMVRGPLAKGLLSGRYGLDAVFEDEIRESFNEGGGDRAKFEAHVAQVERLKEVVDPGIAMVEKSLQYVFSHSARPVVIPGAKSAAQARANAAAGKVELAAVERAALQI